MGDIFVTIQNSISSDGLWYPSISIFYSGCDKLIKCKDCHNPSLQKKGVGCQTNSNQLILDIERSLSFWLEVYEKISICYIGGEPFSKWNRQSVLNVSKYFKQKYNNKVCNIVYSWRYIEDLKDLDNYLKYMDYGVLGEFQTDMKDLNYIPSSSNQYIYDFKNKTKLQPIRKDT